MDTIGHRMPLPPPDGISEFFWLLGVVVITLGSVAGVWLTQRKMRRGVDAIKSQVENTHDSNLRDDLDEVKQAARDSKDAVTEAREAARRNEVAIDRLTLFVSDLNESVKAQAHSIGRRYELTHQEIAELNENLRAHIAEAAPLFAAHEAATHDSK